MVIENKSLGVSAFHLITIKEPIGCFLFIKRGNVPEELMSFSISSWDTDSVPLKQLKQVVRYTPSGMGGQRPAGMVLSSFPAGPR